jgi:hypothetical protein
MDYPFGLGQPIINGKKFFEMLAYTKANTKKQKYNDIIA